MTQRSRGWCFTINNDTYDDMDNILDLHADYLIFGFETGKEGTKHIQGYVYFNNARTLNSLKKMLPRAHLEKAKGSPTQNRTYCSKDNEYYEFGDIPKGEGFRTDLDEMKDAIENGASPIELANMNFNQWCYHRRAFGEYKALLDANQKRECKNYLYTGSDIDKFILLSCDINDVYFADTYDDWRGYSNQSIIVIGHHWANIPEIRRLIMGYPTNMKIPYGTIKLNPSILLVDGMETWKLFKLPGHQYISKLIDDDTEVVPGNTNWDSTEFQE